MKIEKAILLVLVLPLFVISQSTAQFSGRATSQNVTQPPRQGESISGVLNAQRFGVSPSAPSAINSANFDRAGRAGPFYLPPGDYVTDTEAASFTGRWWGEGRAIDKEGNKRAPWATHIRSAPSYKGLEGAGPRTAFNGDFNLSQIASEAWITGVDTVGRPRKGYSYSPPTIPYYSWLYFHSGHNESNSSNDGRTGAPIHRHQIYHAGQGDAVVYNGHVFVSGTKPKSTSFLANPAGVIANGTVTAGADGVYRQQRSFVHV